MIFSARRRGLLAATAVIALAVPLAVTSPAAASAATPGEKASKKLQKAVTLSGLLRHERAFQRIAQVNGNIRAAGTAVVKHTAATAAGAQRYHGADNAQGDNG